MPAPEEKKLDQSRTGNGDEQSFSLSKDEREKYCARRETWGMRGTGSHKMR